MEIIPFNESLIPAASELLCQRYTRDYSGLPGRPPYLQTPACAAEAITAAWQRPGTTGYAAIDGADLLGYLLGDTLITPIWERSAWVRPAGLAVRAPLDPRIVHRLYTRLGGNWVARGIYNHYTVLPVIDPAMLMLWFELNFGIQQTYALADLHDLPEPGGSINGIAIRQAGHADAESVAGFSSLIRSHLAQAPVWGAALPEDAPEIRQGYASLVSDAEMTVWLAEESGEALAIQVYAPAAIDPNDPTTPEACLYLEVASTHLRARRRGLQRLLFKHAAAHARQAGYRYCETDWRSANLEARRTWVGLGFQPQIYRLARRIDPRIAWANTMQEES